MLQSTGEAALYGGIRRSLTRRSGMHYLFYMVGAEDRRDARRSRIL
jgi:hypothetical protein